MSAPETSWLEDLSQEQKKIADLIGEDNFKKLMEEYGGTYFYIPKTDKIGGIANGHKIRRRGGGYYRED